MFVWFIVIALIILMIFFSFSFFIIVAISLLPSFVAFITDKSYHTYQSRCIFSLNLTSLFPFISDAINDGNSSEMTISSIIDAFSLMMIWGGAGLGLVMSILIPIFVCRIALHLDQKKVHDLREEQKVLVEKWGSKLLKEVMNDSLADV